MKCLEIVVETEDGMVIHLNQGQKYFSDDGQDITYEQMLEWLFKGSLQQHGFRGYKGTVRQHSCSNNVAARNAMRLGLLAATL